MDKGKDLAYADQWGRRSCEYVSLGCDAMPVLEGRTRVQCYTDFMRAFRDHFDFFLGNTIVEIQVGMGPAGELRYPSYPERDGAWTFPGAGGFQCHDKYMLGSLMRAAEAAVKPEWGFGGPTDAGGYNSRPDDTEFFRQEGGGWSSEYGEFFMSWYSQMLLEHGDRVLSGATSVSATSPASTSPPRSPASTGTTARSPTRPSSRRGTTTQHPPPRRVPADRAHAGPPRRRAQLHLRGDARPRAAGGRAVHAGGPGAAGGRGGQSGRGRPGRRERAATVRRRGVRPGGGHGRGGADGGVHVPPHGARPVPAGELAPVRRVREADGGRNWLRFAAFVKRMAAGTGCTSDAQQVTEWARALRRSQDTDSRARGRAGWLPSRCGRNC